MNSNAMPLASDSTFFSPMHFHSFMVLLFLCRYNGIGSRVKLFIAFIHCKETPHTGKRVVSRVAQKGETTMAAKDYLPRIDAQFVIWFANFNGKLPAYKDTYGIKDEEINQFLADLTVVKERLELIESTKKTLHSLVEGKDSMISDISKRIRTTAILVKRHKDYKAEDGENLGIIAPADMDEATLAAIAKPVFQALALSNFARLDWLKSAYDGVVIECKRGNETTFTRLGTDTRSPYEDARSNLQPDVPEVRIYRMKYILNEKEVGNWSDEVKIVVLI